MRGKLSWRMIATTLGEAATALWAFVLWQQAQPASQQFWQLLAILLFLVGLTAANGLGIWQRLTGRSQSRLGPGRFLAVRLSALDGPKAEVAIGLLPLAFAFLAPVYPLFQLMSQTGDFWWIGLTLVAFVIGCLLLYVVGRQLYLGYVQSEVTVEVSQIMVGAGEMVDVYVSYRPGRVKTQRVQANLVCRQTSTVSSRKRRADGTTGQTTKTEITHSSPILTLIPEESPTQPVWHKTAKVIVPAGAAPSVPFAQEVGNHWTIEVKAHLSNAPDYTLRYPVLVPAPQTQEKTED